MTGAAPIAMLLFCPNCGQQHIDQPAIGPIDEVPDHAGDHFGEHKRQKEDRAEGGAPAHNTPHQQRQPQRQRQLDHQREDDDLDVVAERAEEHAVA